jgi:hypothetical protein
MQILQEMIDHQKKKLLLIARRLEPAVTADDLLQPQDYPILEQHPEFRYEEGLLHGLESALQALRVEAEGFSRR